MEVSGELYTPAGFTPGEIAPVTHWTRGWVGTGAGLNVVVKRHTLSLPGSGSRRPARLQPLYWNPNVCNMLLLVSRQFLDNPVLKTKIIAFGEIPKQFCRSLP
jgi:hypothetical protein